MMLLFNRRLKSPNVTGIGEFNTESEFVSRIIACETPADYSSKAGVSYIDRLH